MSFTDRIRECSRYDPGDYLPFLAGGVKVGLVRPEFAARLTAFPEVFDVTANSLRLAGGLADADARTRAVEGVLRNLADARLIRGWRDEPYGVAARPQDPPLFLMERAAIPHFGVWATGIHVNGYVRDGKDLLMWIGRRSPDKQISPNKLDQLVAGGRSADYSIRETLIKEAEEEAAISSALAGQAVPVGAISYSTERGEGLRRDVLYIYDLEVPRDFVPVNHDGELAEFNLWPIRDVIARVRDTDDFKFNCALVVIDFLIRHGLIPPEETEYLDLVQGLHQMPVA